MSNEIFTLTSTIISPKALTLCYTVDIETSPVNYQNPYATLQCRIDK